MCFTEKEDGDEEGRGHKRKRKQLNKSSNDEKSLSISFISQQSNLLMNVHWCFTDSSPKRPKSDGEGKSKKYGKLFIS
jgi:hypothetical protein